MIGFLSKAIGSSIAKTGAYAIRQSYKNSQRKNDYNQDIDDSQIYAEIENAKKVTKEAEYYLNWLEKGIDEIVEKQVKSSLCSIFQLKYDYPKLEYPFLLNIFPTKPNEEKVLQIHPVRLFLGRYLMPIKKLNERTLEKKKSILNELLIEFKEKEDQLNSKRAQFEKEYYSEKEKYDREYKETVSKIELIRSDLKANRKADYSPFIQLMIKQTKIIFGQIPQLFDLKYDLDEKSLVAEFLMPNPKQLPTIKSARYLKTYGSTRETEFTDDQLKRNYYKFLENVIFNLCYKLFGTDDLNALNKITLKFESLDSNKSYVEAEIVKPRDIQEWKNQTSTSLKSSFESLKIKKREIGYDYF